MSDFLFEDVVVSISPTPRPSRLERIVPKSVLEAARRARPTILRDLPTVFGAGGGRSSADIVDEARASAPRFKIAVEPANRSGRATEGVATDRGGLARQARARRMPLARPRSVADEETVPRADASKALAAARSTGVAWGVAATGADRSSVTGKGVKVAVLDTGINADHPAFARFKTSAATMEMRDFTDSPDGIADTDGHGTHCAGTLFGGDVDGVRIGVAPGVDHVLIAKVIGEGGRSEALIKALDWVVNEGVDIISMSLGFDFVGYRAACVKYGMHDDAATSMALVAFRENTLLFDQVVERIEAIGGQTPLMFAASGNESRRPDFTVASSCPAALDGVFSVGALAEDGRVASFSNATTERGAPRYFVGCGVGVVSADHAGDGLVVDNGTSMACPHVAGVAALHFETLRLAGSTSPVLRQDVMTDLRRSARDWRNAAAGIDDPLDVGLGSPTAPA